jgi:O-antigen/teichoic acid export membrane protein
LSADPGRHRAAAAGGPPGPPAGRRWRQRLSARLPDSGTLAGRAGRALGWSFLSNALGRLGTVGIGIMLARLLGPHAFGTYAVAWVALLALLSFNDAAVSLAIVRWEDDPREIAPTVSTISVASSLIVYAGCFAAAPVYAAAMGAPAAGPVVRVLALNVVLDGLVATPAALLQRQFRQDRKMIADQVNNWLGAAVSIALAWGGFGAMSLAIGRVAGAVAAGVLFLIFSPEPLRFGFDRTKAGALIKYGTPLAGSALVVFAVTNIDQLIVGRMLGATDLGFYVLAVNLASWPLTIFSRPVRSVAPAAFSRLQHDPAAMRTGFLSAAALLGTAALPACLAISGAAAPAIGLAYGSRWLAAAGALAWLAVLAGFRIFFELIYDYFVVLARTRAVFTVQVGWLVALVPALVAGAAMGRIDGAAAAEVAVAAGLVLPWYLGELRRVGIGALSVAQRLWLPLAVAVAVGLASYGAAWLAPNALTALAVSGGFALAVTGVLATRMRAVAAQFRAGTEAWADGSAARAAGTPGPSTAAAGPPGAPDCMPEVAGPGAAAAALGILGELGHAQAAARAGYLEVTGPLPVYRDVTGLFTARQAEDLPPVYRQTAVFMRWDPDAGNKPAARYFRGTDRGEDPQETRFG